jgi:hypothetical protein
MMALILPYWCAFVVASVAEATVSIRVLLKVLRDVCVESLIASRFVVLLHRGPSLDSSLSETLKLRRPGCPWRATNGGNRRHGWAWRNHTAQPALFLLARFQTTPRPCNPALDRSVLAEGRERNSTATAQSLAAIGLNKRSTSAHILPCIRLIVVLILISLLAASALLPPAVTRCCPAEAELARGMARGGVAVAVPPAAHPAHPAPCLDAPAPQEPHCAAPSPETRRADSLPLFALHTTPRSAAAVSPWVGARPFHASPGHPS